MTKQQRLVDQIPTLMEYANDHQKTVLEEVLKTNGNVTKAAKALGYTAEAPVRNIIKRVKKKQAKHASTTAVLIPDTLPGFAIDRISKHIDKEGNVSGWVITNREKENQFNAMMEAWEEVCLRMPKATLTPAPTDTLDKLLCDYTIGDNHTGMYAWAEEAGEDWNLENSVDILKKAMNHLVYHSPAAKRAFILDVGDFFHADNNDNETSRSKHKLDTDTRWAKVLDAGIECICYLIDIALQKHEEVIYRSVVGNHNDHSAVMLNKAIKLRYSNEPRVTVLDSSSIFNYYQFGVNLLADTHGHTVKAERLPLIMATDVPQMWAATINRIWRTGHVHHLSHKEFPGCDVITYRTLAPKDAWHAASGYRSNREMKCTVYHEDKGTVGTSIVNPSMLGY